MNVSACRLVSIGTVSRDRSGVRVVECHVPDESPDNGAFATSCVSKERHHASVILRYALCRRDTAPTDRPKGEVFLVDAGRRTTSPRCLSYAIQPGLLCLRSSPKDAESRRTRCIRLEDHSMESLPAADDSVPLPSILCGKIVHYNSCRRTKWMVGRLACIGHIEGVFSVFSQPLLCWFTRQSPRSVFGLLFSFGGFWVGETSAYKDCAHTKGSTFERS